MVRIEAPPEVPAQVAADLGETGVPRTLIGGEYRPLCELVLLQGIGEQGLVAFGTSGLFGRIAVDVATRHVVHLPMLESAVTSHVNSDLGAFNRCVAAVIARFPFYADSDGETKYEVARELRSLITGADGTALVRGGFWEMFCSDVGMGDYSDWDVASISGP
nr:SUKH-4 family immunity protein [Streptomyces sp. SID1034]